jgi:non-specific serine/threonine protein kinase
MPGFADIMDGRFAAALNPYREMFEMDPGNPMARLFYIWVLILNGQSDAIAPLVAAFPAEVRETAPARVAALLAHALSGNAAGAREAITPDIEAAATASELFPRMLAQGYALAGMPERALYWLEIAIARGFVNYPFLARHDPFLANLRTLPRFLQLMDRARESWERFEP